MKRTYQWNSSPRVTHRQGRVVFHVDVDENDDPQKSDKGQKKIFQWHQDGPGFIHRQGWTEIPGEIGDPCPEYDDRYYTGIVSVLRSHEYLDPCGQIQSYGDHK